MIKWESIKENFKRGWTYAITSTFVYGFLALVPGFVRDYDIYFVLLRGAIRSLIPDLLIQSILSLGFLFFFLTLFLGWVSKSLEEKQISNIMKRIVVTVIGFVAMFGSSFFVTAIVFGLA